MLLRCLHQLIPLACYVAFAYQFVSMSREYLRYRTTTKVEHFVEDPTDLPAVTFNFEAPIPIRELFAKAFPDLVPLCDAEDLKEKPSWYNSSLGRHCGDIFDKNPEFEQIDEFEGKYWLTELYACFYHYFPNRTVAGFLQELQSMFNWRKCIEPDRKWRYFVCQTNEGSIVSLDKEDLNAICRHLTCLCGDDSLQFSIGWRGAVAVTLFARNPKRIRIRANSRILVSYTKSWFQPFREWPGYVQVVYFHFSIYPS